MDPKDVKIALKNARECIKNKEYKEALKHCKGILAQDKSNYNALVFVGVAADGLDQPDQAVKAYRRATESEPDQPLAWQGLSGFYEKHSSPENDKELVEVYTKLRDFFENDKDKKTEVTKKLANLHIKLGDINRGLELYEKLCSEETEDSVKCSLYTDMLSLFLKLSSPTPPQEDMVIDIMNSLLELDAQLEERIITFYVDILFKKKDHLLLEKSCHVLCEKYPSMKYPLEVKLLIIMDRAFCSELLLPTKDPHMSETMTRLSELDSESVTLKAAQGFQYMCNKELNQAKDCFVEALPVMTSTICVPYYLALTYFLLHKLADAESTIKQCAINLSKKSRQLTVSSGVVSRKVKILQARILLQTRTTDSLQSALAITEELCAEDTSPQVLILRGHILLNLNRLEETEDILSKLEVNTERTALEGYVMFYKAEYTKSAAIFCELMKQDTSNSEYHLMYAKSLWFDKERLQNNLQPCHTALLKSAKLDSYCSEPFEYLGRFYTEIQKDQVKGKRCFQKAFDLDRSNDSAGEALCDIMNKIGEEEDAYQLLLSVTGKASAGCCKWAWLRLGLHQVKHDTASVAISSFQSALRADPKDPHVWECLAEAYYKRGSYTAALKAFTRASELNPNSVYSLYMIACIKQTLSMLTEAIEEYGFILKDKPNYVPALKGIGETYVLLAKHHFSQGFNGRAKENCQNALQFLTRAVCHRPDLSCLWKLMGDSCTIIHPLPSQTFRFNVPENLYKSKESAEECKLNLLQTLELGARCYGRALKLLPDCAALWHDLGFNLYQQALHSNGQESLDMAEKSVEALRKGLSLDPVNHLIWNALGLVYCHSGLKKPSLGQHCFIKSIQAESANVVAWTNLATLYLKNGNIELAHEAYKVAQSLDPNYVSCWIGQAMIAETVGDDDAMDLFRHTTELSPHVEGSLGYAHWVCTLLQDETKHNTEMYSYAIHQMLAVPAASDALVKYLDLVETNPGAYNMYGLLKEQQGLYQTAKEAFQKAVKLLDPSDILLNLVKINLARTLCKLGEYPAALFLYAKFGELDSLQDQCYMGLAFYKAQKYTESYQAYDRALEISTTDKDSSHIHAVLGMVAYKFGDVDGAKASLFQSSQLQPPSRHGLEALCALGLMTCDMTLTRAVLQEMPKVGADNSSPYFTVVHHCLLEDDWELAKAFIQKCIQKSPDSYSLWRLLSRLQLRCCHDSLSSSSSVCAQTALCLRPECQNLLTDATLGLLIDGKHVSKTTNNEALLSAQRATLINPEKLENWCTLVSAVHSQSVLEAESERMTALLKLESSYLRWLISTTNITDVLRGWCQKQVTVVSLLTREITKESVGDDMKVFVNSLLERYSQPNNDEQQVLKLYKSLLSDTGNDEVSNKFTRLTDELIKKSTLSESLIMLMKAVLLMKSNPKLAKHRLVDILVRTKTEFDRSLLVRSITRRCLLHILKDNAEKESELIQVLLTEAEEDRDNDTVNYYKLLFSDSC
ncbi:superkiller complex protein 3-like [Saccostrea echinata]|uniref:superkiller complex protein 3-like n=1 Tax=Saccostrea echinata TaxID=191078 RepID=UPI002A82F8A6|nr:superkiller complex protein 3-like [Saccostrea echinata]